MTEEGSWRRLNLGTPARYQIAVSGHLEDAWSEQLGMTLSHTFTSENDPVTTLTGELIDQAELFGVLNGLYNFGFSLLSVKYIDQTDDSLDNHQ